MPARAALHHIDVLSFDSVGVGTCISRPRPSCVKRHHHPRLLQELCPCALEHCCSRSELVEQGVGDGVDMKRVAAKIREVGKRLSVINIGRYNTGQQKELNLEVVREFEYVVFFFFFFKQKTAYEM